MKVEKTTFQRIVVTNSCGCCSMREYGDRLYKEPLGEHVFTPCEKHRVKSADVQEVLEMMTNQMLDREAEQAQLVPQVNIRGVQQVGDITIEEGAVGIQVEGAATTQTIRVPNLPSNHRRKSADEILNPVTRNRGAGAAPAAPVQKQAAAVGAQLPVHVSTVVEMQMEEEPENPKITSFIEENLFPNYEDDPDNSAGPIPH